MAESARLRAECAAGRDGSAVGIYVHVPFCISKCAYCDFVSYSGLENLHDSYTEALAAEMASAPRMRARTVYFGGGTPTVLGPTRLHELLEALGRRIDIIGGAEMTCEANPDTIDGPVLSRLRAAGFNRLSIGVQSLDDDVLRVLGRTHDARVARRAVDLARQAGFENINIDLIFGAPGESLDSWTRTLEEAIGLDPDHLSVYSLSVEDGTRLAAAIAAGELPSPDDDLAADMMAAAASMLGGAGCERYEISNYARPGRQCRHNVDCWRHHDYLGFGASAHSKIGGVRFSNHGAVDRYVASLLGRTAGCSKMIDSGEAISCDGMELSRMPQRVWSQSLSVRDRACEATILGLRLLGGMSRDRLDELWEGAGIDVGVALDQLRADGLLKAGDSVRLTERGAALANEVFRAFV